MRKIIEQAVVTLDGQISTPQDWLPTRWAGEFELGTGGSFSRMLLEHRLVDEYLFWLFPVIAAAVYGSTTGSRPRIST